MKSYNEILSDVTKTATKIPQSDYLDTGKYRIFDQGKEYSVGFSNDEQGVVSDYPYIIFGDHTRVVKYVNEPCFIGADGVKLLKVINKDFNPRFVYYNILAKPIENQGYARHFKFLKEIQFTEKTLSVQTNIVTELDTIQSAIDNKKQQLSLLDEAVKSRFIEMFGDIRNQEKYKGIPLSNLCKTMTGGTPPTSKPEYYEGTIPWITTVSLGPNHIDGKNAKGYITEEAIKNSATKLIPVGNILFGTRVGVGKSSINDVDICTNQDIIALIGIDESRYSKLFIKHVLDQYQPYFDSIKKGATILGITTDDVKKSLIPDVSLSLQKEFENFVQQIDKSKFVVKQQIADLQELLDSKMQEYFS